MPTVVIDLSGGVSSGSLLTDEHMEPPAIARLSFYSFVGFLRMQSHRWMIVSIFRATIGAELHPLHFSALIHSLTNSNLAAPWSFSQNVMLIFAQSNS